MKHIIPTSILSLGSLIVLLHVIALENSYYFLYSWFDIPMHFLGGFLVSLFACFILVRIQRDFLPHQDKRLLFFEVLLFTIIVGFLWETFELIFEITLYNEVLYIKDTILDFIMNIVGAVVGYFFFLRTEPLMFKKNNKHE